MKEENKNKNASQEANEQNVADTNTNNANAEETKQEHAENKKELSVEEQLAEAQKQLAELKDQYLRKAAEFENYRKRTIKEKSDLILNGAESTVKAILPILDDFERAVADKTEDAKAIKEGMQLIFNKFVKTLKGLGVEKIQPTKSLMSTFTKPLLWFQEWATTRKVRLLTVCKQVISLTTKLFATPRLPWVNNDVGKKRTDPQQIDNCQNHILIYRRE